MSIRSILLLALLGATVEGSMCVPLRADEPSAIFVMKVDGSGLRRLADVGGYRIHGSPRWSHSGKRLVFDAIPADSAAGRWFLINADGSGLAQIGLGAHADWSPDDKQLVFAIGENAPIKKGTWVQNVDGRGRQWLAGGSAPRWSPSGGELATINGKALEVLDLIESRPRRLLEMPSGLLGGFDWSPDGKQLAFVTHGDGQNELWIVPVSDPDTKKKRLSGDLDGYVAWSPDGKRLAVALDRRIQLLGVDGSDAPQPIPGQEGINRMPAWSADGRWIAFSSDRKTPALVPVARTKRSLRLEEVKRHTRGNVVFTMALSPDGRWALLGGTSRQRNVQVWNLVEGDTTNLDFHGEAVALSPDGRTLASCGSIVNIELGSVENGELIRHLHSGGMCTNVMFSPDGKRLVSGSINKQAVVWDVASGKRICAFKKHGHPIARVAFMPNGEEVVSTSQDKMLRVWDAGTAKERLAMAHPDAVWGLAVSPDGALIATGTGGMAVGNPITQRIVRGPENTLRLWDAASGELVREMKGHTNVVYAIDFSPDGRTLVSGGWDGTIRLWDVDRGEPLASVQGQGSVFAVAFTPDGGEVLVGGGANRFGNERIQSVRDEQVRLYRIVEANDPTQTTPERPKPDG